MHMFSFALVLALALPGQAQTEEESFLEQFTATYNEQFELFNQCRSMALAFGVQKNESSKDLQLTEAQVQTAVESRLRSARLYGKPPENKEIVMSYPFLRVHIHVVGLAYTVSVEFRKMVKDYTTTFNGWASTWESGNTGTHGNDGNHILSVLSSLIDKFLVEYLRVNESACGGPGE